jgi:hypothetical protein
MNVQRSGLHSESLKALSKCIYGGGSSREHYKISQKNNRQNLLKLIRNHEIGQEPQEPQEPQEEWV